MAAITSGAPVRQSTWCSRLPSLRVCQPAVLLSPPPDLPDPSVYSQAPRLAAGLDTTWDNPDIAVYANPVYTNGRWQIDAQWFLDDVLVTVRNNSATAAAINTVVTVSYGPTGIGMPRIPLISQLVSLKASETRQLSIALPAAILNQPLKAESVFVDLYNPYDADTSNDHGENVSGISLLARGDSEAFSIDLGNTTAAPLTYFLSLAQNTVAATLQSQQVTVAPGATATTWVSYTAPATPAAYEWVTVKALDSQGNLLGGYTGRLYFS